MRFDPIYLLALLLALTLHEWAHAFAATRLGDPTPHNEGRLTVNPVAHLDPIGTLMILFGPFGWAKPVPINPAYFRDHRRGTMLTAIAGPLMNLFLAIVSYICLALMAERAGSGSLWSLLNVPVGGSALHMFSIKFFSISLVANLSLMAFNLIPVTPLDGSRVLAALLPPHLEMQYEEIMRYGVYILLGLILFDSFLPFSPVILWIEFIAGNVLRLLDFVAGFFV